VEQIYRASEARRGKREAEEARLQCVCRKPSIKLPRQPRSVSERSPQLANIFPTELRTPKTLASYIPPVTFRLLPNVTILHPGETA
jgi:hypothetical protein